MSRYDISFDQAYSAALKGSPLLSGESISILDAPGRIASEDIYAGIDAPSVDSSLKDGFAVIADDIRYARLDSPVTLDLIGRIEAGSQKAYHVKKGQAVRILTGAEIPGGVDAVLSDEFASLSDGVVIAQATAESGRNIMKKGSDVKKGDCLITHGTLLTPGHISYLVAGGITHLNVYKIPRVGLLATGDEILMPGDRFQPGKLFASNMALQAAWLKSYQFQALFAVSGDHFQALSDAILSMADKTDAIITSGGAWKGDRDLIVSVLDHLGWQKKFHRVRMGPGKAVGMGLLNNTPVFCLPGGPPSNEMAFLMIAFPAICKMAGFKKEPYLNIRGKLTQTVGGEISWTQCIHCKVQKTKNGFMITPIKLRSRLKSMADAQGVFTIPEGTTQIVEGSDISVKLLDPTVLAIDREV